ncbi:hypothetical protein OW763_09080 [Clostridium aestuarii]|uniref:SbsA Ig-like domain-containing protein n=1 Tax=Clostridium aestuarii TaxID=338193 RepID=A0ABT4CZS7_9CLOT|nr:hypothetical protein [Clostridium aestuarii]MCY6484491.1 hypothetical protein [Clostridium aestuarii]
MVCKIIYKRVVGALIIMIMLIGCIPGCVQASMENVQTVSKDKVWTIKFNQKIKFDEDTKKAVSVLDEAGNKIYTTVELGRDSKSIIVKPPIKHYNMGETYTLNVDKNIYSLHNNKLSKTEEIKFKIEKVDTYASMQKIKEGDIIISEPGKEYLLNRLDKVKDIEDRDLKEANWDLFAYKYQYLDGGGAVIENKENASKLKLPFQLKGWFAVYIGYATGTEGFKVKGKEKEEVINIFNNTRLKGRNQYVEEAFAFIENFDNNNIIIEPLKDKKAKLTYIKVVGLNEKQVKLHNSYNEYIKYKRVVYDNDGFSDFFWGKCPSTEELKKVAVDSLKSVDAGEINWEIGTTGWLNYDSYYAGKSFEGSEKYDAYTREGDKLARTQIRNILESGKSPLEIVAKRAKEQGLRVNVSMRMNTFYNDKARYFLNGTIYDKYKQNMQNDSFFLSYYYSRYRNYIMNVLKEVSQVDNVDAITLDFCRYPKVMGNEVSDKRKIDIMNRFMREVRKKIPSYIKISVRVPYLNPDSYGFDIETWVQEGLINRLIPSSITHEDFYDINKYVEMVKGTKVELYVGITANLKGKDLTPETEALLKKGLYIPDNQYLTVEEYLIRAHQAYEAGAKGIFLFNTLNDVDFTKDFSPKFEFLGDKVKVNRWYEFEYESYLVHNKIKIMI